MKGSDFLATGTTFVFYGMTRASCKFHIGPLCVHIGARDGKFFFTTWQVR
ncbi:unnamed protein product [Hymenolepis diminuta]|uniref:Uncharacterized protein n=1 Tax=Hymenolepis diminuta TaxID=6216 RepID=A0A564YFV0_HYMDI|nr:unnamed protein product [Hymenolepis diminuta]